MALSMTTSVFSAIQTQQAITPRQVITQTITNDDYTTTAVVTLGPGDPSSTPLDSPSDSQGSSGLSSAGIGILIGSIVGAIVLAILVWMCCLRCRMDNYDDYETEYDRDYDIMQPPPRVYVRFPHSIPPPIVPTYTAVPIERTYTSNGTARRATSSYIIYDDDPRRIY